MKECSPCKTAGCGTACLCGCHQREPKKIYLFCLATGRGTGAVNGSTPGGDVEGYAIAEDHQLLVGHVSSNETFSKHDLGLTSKWNHDVYAEYYPEGYELVWIEDTQRRIDLMDAVGFWKSKKEKELENKKISR